MKSIGIIAAMQEEMNEIKKIMENVVEIKIFNLLFVEGKINNKKCVLVECGIGKVNAARTTQIMLDNYDIEYVINIGTAGALNEELDVTDIVIGNRLVQHDFDISAFGKEKGYITGIGKYIYSDENLISNCKEVINEDINKEYKVLVGTIASGDIFCTDVKKAKEIRSEFSADCIEMEGAAIAQICYLAHIPFIVIRSISDSPDGRNAMTFEKYLTIASKRGAEFINNLIKD